MDCGWKENLPKPWSDSLAIFQGVLRVADLGLRRLGDVDADGNAKGGMVTDCSLDDEDFD